MWNHKVANKNQPNQFYQWYNSSRYNTKVFLWCICQTVKPSDLNIEGIIPMDSVICLFGRRMSIAAICTQHHGAFWRKTNPQPWWFFTPSLNINESTSTEQTQPAITSAPHQVGQDVRAVPIRFLLPQKKQPFHSFPKVEWQRGSTSYQYPIITLHVCCIYTHMRLDQFLWFSCNYT